MEENQKNDGESSSLELITANDNAAETKKIVDTGNFEFGTVTVPTNEEFKESGDKEATIKTNDKVTIIKPSISFSETRKIIDTGEFQFGTVRLPINEDFKESADEEETIEVIDETIYRDPLTAEYRTVFNNQLGTISVMPLANVFLN